MLNITNHEGNANQAHNEGFPWQFSGLRVCTPTAGGMDSIHGQGTKILHAASCSQKMLQHHIITPLQRKLLDELKWFDGFCREHNLSYYAIGGTLLGAMRHQGFIPWDDDIDLGMPRADYEKLKAFEGKIFNHYIIETYASTEIDYCYPASKVFDTNTTLIERKRYNVSRGVFLDIFPKPFPLHQVPWIKAFTKALPGLGLLVFSLHYSAIQRGPVDRWSVGTGGHQQTREMASLPVETLRPPTCLLDLFSRP